MIDTVYMEAAADTEDAAAFQTNVENLLDSWVSQDLPELSVDVARQTLIGQFLHVLNFADTDGVYDRLREEVRTRCVNAFVWDPRWLPCVEAVGSAGWLSGAWLSASAAVHAEGFACAFPDPALVFAQGFFRPRA